jgi:hypothetical protein
MVPALSGPPRAPPPQARRHARTGFGVNASDGVSLTFWAARINLVS